MADNFSPGTVISARDRLWRVDQQDGEVLTATPIDSGGDGQQRFYLPMEEEINRGKLEWPSRETIGTPQAQDLLLRAHRLSMLHGTAPLLSLQRSRVIPKNFQLVPVVMALEMRKRVRMLIADDVGLGKTIEAGLIITELMARQLASRILVVARVAPRAVEGGAQLLFPPARVSSRRATAARCRPVDRSVWVLSDKKDEPGPSTSSASKAAFQAYGVALPIGSAPDRGVAYGQSCCRRSQAPTWSALESSRPPHSARD